MNKREARRVNMIQTLLSVVTGSGAYKFFAKKSLTKKIIFMFAAMFVLLLVPVFVQTYKSIDQARVYRDLIGGITYVEQLNTIVSENIEPITWNIVAGKITFEDSGVMELVTDIRDRMSILKNNTTDTENRGIMEMALRALSTLANYLSRLETQIEERYRVSENELLFDEILVCVAGVNELLQEYMSRQIEAVSILNQSMYDQSIQGFSTSILLVVFVTVSCALAFLYIIKKSIEDQKQRQMLEYKVLSEQITPHFLYNTLDAIIWAAEAKDSDTVINIVTSLSSFFRTSLSRGDDFVPISREIEHVRSYLNIQQMRYNDVLSYEINVEDGLSAQIMLKLLLQPLVENSLYHGIKSTRERGKIVLNVKRWYNGVRFSVSDNGIGMTQETLAKLRRNIDKDIVDSGFGLYNVNRRLKLYYNRPEGLNIESVYGSGTEVSFILDILDAEGGR